MQWPCSECTEWAEYAGPFLKFTAPVYDDVESLSVRENAQFAIRIKTGILNVATFKYSLHKFTETTLRWKLENNN